MLRIAEAQPQANLDTLELFQKTIEHTQGNLTSAVASIREAKGDVGLL